MDMNDPPGRPELEARLDAARAHSDAQSARVDAQFARMDARFEAMDAKFSALSNQVAAVIVKMEQVLADNKNTRATILVVSLGSMFAAVTMVIAVQVGLMNAFSTGLSSRAALAAGWSPPASAASGPAQR